MLSYKKLMWTLYILLYSAYIHTFGKILSFQNCSLHFTIRIMTTHQLNFQAFLNVLNQPKNKVLLKTLALMLLFIYIIFALANMVWQIVPSPPSPTIPLQVTQKQGSTPVQTNSINDLIALNIFGEADKITAQPISTVTDAPETKLNLVLTGVVASTTEDDGAAIIANRNKQNTYGIGDKIEGTQATLNRVFADRVIISNRGTKETLMLDGIDFSKMSSSSSSVNDTVFFPANTSIPKSVVKQVEGPSADSIAQLRAAPEKFIDFIKVAPVREDDELRGYRVSPGKETALFNDSGLKAGDIITYINGLDLTQPREAVQAMQALREADSLELTLLRNDQPMTLSLSLP